MKKIATVFFIICFIGIPTRRVETDPLTSACVGAGLAKVIPLIVVGVSVAAGGLVVVGTGAALGTNYILKERQKKWEFSVAESERNTKHFKQKKRRKRGLRKVLSVVVGCGLVAGIIGAAACN